jgi:hypothetical protein
MILFSGVLAGTSQQVMFNRTGCWQSLFFMERTGQVFLILTLSFHALACLFNFFYFAYITTRIDLSTDVYLERSKVRNDIHLSLSRRTDNRTKRGAGVSGCIISPLYIRGECP